MSASNERTEEATPKRKAALLAQGVRAHSALAQAACGLLVAVVLSSAISARAPAFGQALRIAANGAVIVGRDPTAAALVGVCVRIVQQIGCTGMIAATFIACLVAALVATCACGPLGVSFQALAPRFARLRPAIQRFISVENLVRAFAGTLATCMVTALVLPLFVGELERLALRAEVEAQAVLAAHAVQHLWMRTMAALMPVAAIDVIMQRRRQAKSTKMTPREVREERFQTEGRPEVRQRRRAIGAKRARGLRVAAIRRATAVIANPEHLAVALRYAPPAIEVPTVVARGVDRMAQVLKRAAQSFDVPVIEAPELARDIFERTDIDEPIPEECYAAVAAVFTWIMRVHGSLRRGDEDDV
ncbi:MAG: EscU/YscU/HrcU family type III secretion system export apparatus switch protein [Candidatus Eremiobacteraeota bacterium]|nr:EscU/YscU/HrcU family type III secretion system export apparatus switch protein [Candidatus Eremiobacteraeota bacterium]